MITTLTPGTAFRLDAGRYALIARDRTGSLPDPRELADHCDELHIEPSDAARVVDYEGMQVLTIPVGRDSGGSPSRTVAVGEASIIACGEIAIVAVGDEICSPRPYPYASHLEQVTLFEAGRMSQITLLEGAIDFLGCGDLRTIDIETPGAFTIDGKLIDMVDDATAEAFGYGSDAFNAALDEHGFHVVIEPVRAALRARTDHDGVGLLAFLDKLGDTAVAYYAPVAD